MSDLQKSLRVAVIIDPMGAGGRSPEEEIAEVSANLKAMLGKCLIYEAPHPFAIKEGTDVVVYDYGGFLPGCDDMLRDNARELIRWAEDHTKGLVLVISAFTYDHQIEVELRERDIDQLDNIRVMRWWERVELPNWFAMMLPPLVPEKPKKALRSPRRGM